MTIFFTRGLLTKLFLVLIALTLVSCHFRGDSNVMPFLEVTTFSGHKEFGEPFGIAVKDEELYVSDGEKRIDMEN